MNVLIALVLLVIPTSSTVEDGEWLWQFVDDEQADYMKLNDREIARLLGETAGEGEGEGEGVGNNEHTNETGQAPAYCLEVAKPGILFDGFFKPISDMNWYLVGKGYEETSGGAWCPYLSEMCETVSKSFISSNNGFFMANSIIDLATRVQSQYLERGVGMPGAGTFCRRIQKDDIITMTYSFVIESSRSVVELSNDNVFVTEMKKVGLKILGLPAASLNFIEVAFYPKHKLSSSAGSVSIEYTAEIPKSNVVDVTVESDPDALESDVLAAVKSAEDASGISYGVTVDSVSLNALTNSLGSAWTDAVAHAVPALTPAPSSETPSQAPTAEGSPQPTPEASPAPTPPEPEPTPIPEPTQAPVPEQTQVPAPEPPEPQPEPTPVPEPTQAPVPEPTQVPPPEPTQETVPEPSEAPTTSEPEPEGPAPVPTPTPTYLISQVEELSSASIRNASAAWSLIVAIAIAALLADVAKP